MSATSVGEEGRDLIRWARSIKDIGFHIHPIPNGKVTSRITSLIGNCKEKKKTISHFAGPVASKLGWAHWARNRPKRPTRMTMLLSPTKEHCLPLRSRMYRSKFESKRCGRLYFYS